MANILTSYPIRYTQDKINDDLHGLVMCGENKLINLSNADNVTQINVSTVPNTLPDSVDMRFAFLTYQNNTSSNWFKLDSNGNAVSLDYQDLTCESVLAEGNTLTELQAITDAPALAGKYIRYAVAVSCSDSNNVQPAFKLDFQCERDTPQESNEYYSPLYEFPESITVTEIYLINAGETIPEIDDGSIHAKLTVYARWNDLETNEMTQYVPYKNLVGIQTDKIQYKVTAYVDMSSMLQQECSLEGITTNYNQGNSISGDNEIYSIVKDWRKNLRHCRILVKHAPLNNNSINTHIAFRVKPQKITGEELGTGTGASTVYSLAHNNGIKLDTVNVYINGVKLVNGYNVNCEEGTITLQANSGDLITCDYQYGWEAEDWNELKLYSRESFDEYDLSEYKITLPANTNGTVKSMGAVKIGLGAETGTNTLEVIGTGTGQSKTYRLSNPVSDFINVYSNGELLSASNYYLHDDTRYITIAAPSGAELKATYNWVSESPVLYEFSSIFSE